MMNPFEEVEPLAPIDPMELMMSQLSRAMLWDMVGPYSMRDKAELLGQHPASTDVLEAEAKEMWERKRSLLPFGMDFPFLCHVASETASTALLSTNPNLNSMGEMDKAEFRAGNVRLGTAIAEAVVSHMLEKGLIKYGDNNEFLGK